MSKINIDPEHDPQHDPETAVFWASFADETGQKKKNCPTVTLYENEKGEFFSVREPPENDQRGVPMQYEPIENLGEWLQERMDWINR